MLEKIETIKLEALLNLEAIDSARDLESWRVQHLGKKSPLTQILRGLAGLSIEERKAAGAAANELKRLLEESSARKGQAIRAKEMAAEAGKESIDISLPGRPYPAGRLHPITQTIEEICDIFVSLGFQVVEGPDVEWDYYNFEALNIPAEHPARDSMSSYWVDTPAGDRGKQMLRTHGTAISARVVEKMRPPIRTIEPARVYRYEATDATHLNIYHNIDGLAVDRGITMADLKGVLFEFVRRYFGENRKIRFRTDFFPFVEPGGEIAIDCGVCHGSGCRVCKDSGWLEILGCGMTHPEVLRRGGIDPEEYTSFAFGMGLERLPMLRYGIEDIRHFYNNDLRFLRQF
ncbi:MAG: phenylalanine--tRNA ligase subunit alpha [Chloroflexi bacterium RBG_16_56_11]|nr:MAG: phenylalanine--tRNA ligase subunit alpha [Chloroflexi bacterium RBG_16_56_11]